MILSFVLFLSLASRPASASESCTAYLDIHERSCATCPILPLGQSQAQLWVDQLEDLGYVIKPRPPQFDSNSLKQDELLLTGLYSMALVTGQSCPVADPYRQACTAKLSFHAGFSAQPIYCEHSNSICGNGMVSDYAPCNMMSDIAAIPSCPLGPALPENPIPPKVAHQDKPLSPLLWMQGSPEIPDGDAGRNPSVDWMILKPFSYESDTRSCKIENVTKERCNGYGCDVGPSDVGTVFDQNSYLVCHDRQSGKEVWRHQLAAAKFLFHQFWTQRLTDEKRSLFNGAVASIGNWFYLSFDYADPKDPYRERGTFAREIINATTGQTLFKFSGFGTSSSFSSSLVEFGQLDWIGDKLLVVHYPASKIIRKPDNPRPYGEVATAVDELIDLSDSQTLRHYELSRGETAFSPYYYPSEHIRAATTDDRLYSLPYIASSGESSVVATDLKTGKTLWRYNNSTVLLTEVRAWGRMVYATGLDLSSPSRKATTITIDSLTGKEQWLQRKDYWPLASAGDFFFAVSSVDTAGGYAGGFALKIHGLDVATGLSRWKAEAGFGGKEDFLLEKGNLYVSVAKIIGMSGSTYDKTIVAINGTSGAILWTRYLGTETSLRESYRRKRLSVENGALRVLFDVTRPPVYLNLDSGELIGK